MKGNHGSAFIPDGLLPPVSHPKYHRDYRRLRMQHDPLFREYDGKRRNTGNPPGRPRKQDGTAKMKNGEKA